MTLCTRASTGGAQLNSILVADELEKRGFKTASCFLFNTGPMSIKRDCIVFGNASTSFIGFFSVIKKLYSFIRDFKPDIVIGFHPLANVLLAIFSIFCSYRVMATQRNPSNSMSLYTVFLDKFCGCFLYDEILCVSQSVAESFIKYPIRFKKKIFVVYNGLPDISLESNSKFQIVSSSDTIVLGYIGRIDVQKNPLLLADIMYSLKSFTNKKFLFLVAGSGPLLDELKNKINLYNLSDSFLFLGEVSGEDVIKFYNSIDIFVMPSFFEGFGRTLIENMMFGNPMVLSDISVFHELADGYACFSTAEATSYASNVLSIVSSNQLNDQKLKQRIKNRGAEFTVSRMIDGYESSCVRLQLK